MTSRALINTYAVIAIAESQCNILMARLPDDDLEKILPDLIDCKQACGKALGAWVGQIDKNGMRKLNSILDRFQEFIDNNMGVVEHTSTTLALLETLRSKLKDKTRKAAINNLIEAYYKVHEHFDVGLNQLEAYYRAGKLETKWAQLMGGAA